MTNVMLADFATKYTPKRTANTRREMWLLCTNFHRQRNNCFLLVYIKHYMFRPQWVILRCYTFFIQLSNCNVHIYNLYTCSS
jgi:hypothetical protein